MELAYRHDNIHQWKKCSYDDTCLLGLEVKKCSDGVCRQRYFKKDKGEEIKISFKSV